MSITVKLIGGLGNRMFMWAHAKALSEQTGEELRNEAWVGESIFTLDGHKSVRPDGRYTTGDVVLTGYFQSQADLIYTRADCRRWFKLKPKVEAMLEGWAEHRPVAHIRRGDYLDAGYPVITEQAAKLAAANEGYPIIGLVSDDYPDLHAHFTLELAMFPDFYRMMTAPVLFRSNSTFSFWAGVLSHGKVFSPIITGLAGGVEHDHVLYVPGNWPRCADLPFVEDLYLKEQ